MSETEPPDPSSTMAPPSGELSLPGTLDAATSRTPLRSLLQIISGVIQAIFGCFSLIAILAILAAVPFFNFAVLGYFLEAERRIVHSGRWRDIFPWRQLMPRLGSISLGMVSFLLPLSWLKHATHEALLVNPHSQVAQRLQFWLTVAGFAIAIHLILAIARGGSLGCFFRPWKNLRFFLRQVMQPGYWNTLDREFWKFINALKLFSLTWLGFRAFCGSLAILFLPTLLLASTRKTQGLPVLITLVGGVWLIPMLAAAPFLQLRFALAESWRENWRRRDIHLPRQRAPLCWLLATVVTYALALPLYLTTVVLPPRDGWWLITPLFILTIYPARLLVAWAYRQSLHRPARAHWTWRWFSTGLTWGLLGAYVFLLFFTQFVGQNGKLVLFQHHAILLPSPW